MSSLVSVADVLRHRASEVVNLLEEYKGAGLRRLPEKNIRGGAHARRASCATQKSSSRPLDRISWVRIVSPPGTTPRCADGPTMVRIEYQLLKAEDGTKDQSCFLCRLNRARLQPGPLFTIGHLYKRDVHQARRGSRTCALRG